MTGTSVRSAGSGSGSGSDSGLCGMRARSANIGREVLGLHELSLSACVQAMF